MDANFLMTPILIFCYINLTPLNLYKTKRKKTKGGMFSALHTLLGIFYLIMRQVKNKPPKPPKSMSFYSDFKLRKQIKQIYDKTVVLLLQHYSYYHFR